MSPVARSSCSCARSLCIADVTKRSPAQGGLLRTATILGQVTDESGATLPGVTVTLRSPALQVPTDDARSPTSAENTASRRCRLACIASTTSCPGSRRCGSRTIRLTAGFSAKLDQSMKIGALAETVTVSGQTPLVDVTQASTATTLETEALELIPSGTNGIVGFLAHVPGAQTNVEVGGSAITDTNIFTVERTRRRDVVAARRGVCRREPDQRERHALQLQRDRRGAGPDERQTAPTRRSAA